MNEHFVESWMQELERIGQEGTLHVLELIKFDLIDSISTPVTGKGRRAIRSSPGRPPFTESGELIKSISVRILTGEQSNDVVGGELVISARHAGWLENGTIQMAARPFIQPILDKWKDGLAAQQLENDVLVRL